MEDCVLWNGMKWDTNKNTSFCKNDNNPRYKAHAHTAHTALTHMYKWQYSRNTASSAWIFASIFSTSSSSSSYDSFYLCLNCLRCRWGRSNNGSFVLRLLLLLRRLQLTIATFKGHNEYYGFCVSFCDINIFSVLCIVAVGFPLSLVEHFRLKLICVFIPRMPLAHCFAGGCENRNSYAK